MDNSDRKPLDDSHLVENCLKNGDLRPLNLLIDKYHDRLLRIVEYRMDARLKRRLDAQDIVQEACLEATERISEYLSQDVAFFVWLRFLVLQQLTLHVRRHLRTKARDPQREVSVQRPPAGASSVDIANLLIGSHTSPSVVVGRQETQQKIEHALAEMEEIDREILTLRHMEDLSNAETAEILGISQSAASNRHLRAIRRLKSILDGAI